MLHSIWQKIWKTQQWPQDWKKSVFIPIPKKTNAKECSSYHTIALISHASKVMLKILQDRLQQYMNCEILGSCTIETLLEEFWALLCLCVKWVQLCGSLNILWYCLSLVLKWKLRFSSSVATADFSKFAGILSAALSQHHLLGFEIALLEFHHLH